MPFKLQYSCISGPEHPNPGVPYWCSYYTAYLPYNPAGQELCHLLRRAFDERLIFTIGEENTIVWNGIELKTSHSGGPAKYVLHRFIRLM